MTDVAGQLARLKDLADAATEKPWRYPQSPTDSAFVATACEAVPVLVDALLKTHNRHYEIPGGWCNYDGFAWPCPDARDLQALAARLGA